MKTADTIKYQDHLQMKAENFEDKCIRCGECCGASDDPCRNLVEIADKVYFCKDYNNRIGPQKTVSGKEFNCVDIREHIKGQTLRNKCGYKKV